MLVNIHTPVNLLNAINQLVVGGNDGSDRRNGINIIVLVIMAVLSWEPKCDFHKRVMSGVMVLFSFCYNLPYFICRNWGMPTASAVTGKPRKLIVTWINRNMALWTERKPFPSSLWDKTKLYTGNRPDQLRLLDAFAEPAKLPAQISA